MMVWRQSNRSVQLGRRVSVSSAASHELSVNPASHETERRGSSGVMFTVV